MGSMATTAEQLAQVEAAIAKAEQARSTRHADGTFVEHADLSTLYAQRSELQAQVNQETAGPTIRFASLGRGRR